VIMVAIAVAEVAIVSTEGIVDRDSVGRLNPYKALSKAGT